MTTRTQLKAGRLATNHNDGLKVRTSVKAGGWSSTQNHNESLRVAASR